ncbi:MAG: SDR family NAD(P)-dependent oxidoreductase [Thalassospira sp.]|uniref:SDR family NAD(P)-dependent oxidoreductase n=1 Tax=Thalassospira sp. TaxID=1912094 RepID=UPI003A8C24AC
MTSKGVALVTGAGGAMGSACVARLTRDGYKVALMDKNEDGLKESVKKASSDSKYWIVDQTNETETRTAVQEIEDQLGPIEALANTVGWCEGTKFADESSDYWHKVVAVNYLAELYVTHPVLKGMIERERGKIVYITSDAAKIGTGGEAVYAGAKAAVCAFAKSIARENARHNIRVNCTAPGATETPLMREVEQQNPEMIKRMVKLVPFRRLGTPEEQADVVSFLLSDDARWITGQVISTSGGLTMC